MNLTEPISCYVAVAVSIGETGKGKFRHRSYSPQWLITSCTLMLALGKTSPDGG